MIKRIVVDTSVLIAALIGEAGPAREVLRLCLQGKYMPILGNALFAEYEDVSARQDIRDKCPVTPGEIQDLLAALYASSSWVPVYFLWRPNLQDEADNHVLELAIAGQASWLVTHNIRDFKNAQLQFPELMICTPDEFLRGERNGNFNH